MGKYYYRPNVAAAVDYGQVETIGGGTVLGDNNDGTFKRYFENAGSILTYSPFDASVIPGGADIIAIRVGHRQRNTGFFGLYNGWVSTYLRINGKKEAGVRAYQQDGYQDGGREILSNAMYNTDLAAWPASLISTMGTESGAAVGEIGPSGNRWCVCSESFIALVYEDAVPVPDTPYPANNSIINTSSVSFTANSKTTQSEQPISVVFQVSRDNTFATDVRTFVGGLQGDTAANAKSIYVSDKLKDSYTNLGPGKWFMRMKGRDLRKKESAWGATTSFTITHDPLPVPSLIVPAVNATVATPYGTRTASINSQPTGDRKVGATFQFSKTADFSLGIVQWTNRTGGVMVASAISPGLITYDPAPSSTVKPGLDGSVVSVEDPSQYLSQGTWYGRVRCTDIFGQSGAWSGNVSFNVLHRPIVASLIPSGGMSFDPNTTMASWKFTDPWSGDYQTAYRLQLLDASSNVLQDTGKIASSISQAKINAPVNQLHNLLTVALLIWDADDYSSSAAVSTTFRYENSPVITLVNPVEGSQVNNGQPQLNWSVVYSRNDISQKSFQVKWIRADNGKVEFDSGVVNSAITNYIPPKPILKNLTGYQLSLTIIDTDNLTSTVTRNFSTNFDRPTSVLATSDASGYSKLGYVGVTWTGTPDPYFKEWRIYRRKVNADTLGDPVLAGTVTNPATKAFKDWLIAGDGYFVHNVVQAAYRFGSIVESALDPNADPFKLEGGSYWLIVDNHEELNTRLFNVSGDKFTTSMSKNSYVIVDGGTRQINGTRLGRSGNMTCQVRGNVGRSATAQREAIESIAWLNRGITLRTPFGETVRISLGDIGVDRMSGVGLQDFADLDIPYVQVGKVENPHG